MEKKDFLRSSKATVIEAPLKEYPPKKFNLFLAGGITNCPDWQDELINTLKDAADLNIFNPRRKEFPINDPASVREQGVPT